MCVLSIKVPIRKKSGNLFNDPRIKDNKTNRQRKKPKEIEQGYLNYV